MQESHVIVSGSSSRDEAGLCTHSLSHSLSSLTSLSPCHLSPHLGLMMRLTANDIRTRNHARVHAHTCTCGANEWQTGRIDSSVEHSSFESQLLLVPGCLNRRPPILRWPGRLFNKRSVAFILHIVGAHTQSGKGRCLTRASQCLSLDPIRRYCILQLAAMS